MLTYSTDSTHVAALDDGAVTEPAGYCPPLTRREGARDSSRTFADAPPTTAGRTLPHNTEAEESLLSCCFVDGADGADTVARCIEAQITPASFYLPAHGVIFACLLDLYNRRVPIDVAIVAQELQATKQLDALGGFPFLLQVSNRTPTTAQSPYYIETVRDQALRRELVRSATATIEDCHNFTGGIDELTAAIGRRLRVALERAEGRVAREMEWDALLQFEGKADPDCLMGKRFLCRTGGAVIVAPSGVGKSVLSLQLGTCAALGRPFFGVQMTRPMRVLYAQAEDDFGDVAETAQGIVHALGISEAEVARLRQQMRIVRWNDAAGDKFLGRVRSEHNRWPFDLIIVNPLFSFAGCNVSDQAEMSAFLRNGLNPILNDTGSAAVIVHHTNKPPTDGKDRPDANSDLRYLGSGSAELTNWARAYITLQGVKSAGEHVYKLVFAKRGMRAGIVGEDGKPTTHVFIEHSREGLCWLTSDYEPTAKGAGGKFQQTFSLKRALEIYDPRATWSKNSLAIAEDQGIHVRTVERHRHEFDTEAAA